MKIVFASILASTLATLAFASSPGLVPSQVFSWDKMAIVKTPTGERRDVVDGPTATLGALRAHISTLNPGERSSAPRLHEQEEVIFVKDGQIEATYDGQTAVAAPGSLIFFAPHAVTSLKNVGTTPATYLELNYTPRS